MAKCEHAAVEQVRGKMGVGDYFDVVAHSQADVWNARANDDYHELVELDDANRTDMRIICSKCFQSTGWMKVDAPNMPAGIGIPAVRAKWDEIK